MSEICVKCKKEFIKISYCKLCVKCLREKIDKKNVKKYEMYQKCLL